MISTPGITGSNGVGKTSPPPVTVAPITTIRSRTASGGDVAVQHRGRADGADRAVAAVERERQHMIDVGRDAPSRQHQAVRLDRRLGAGRQRRDAQRERQFDLVAVRNSIGTPRGVPEMSVVRLTTPMAA